MAKTYFETFKIVTVSSNTNSFGLYGVVILSKTGKAFEIGMGSINEPAKGQALIGELTLSGDLVAIKGKSYEIPRKLSPPPAEVILEVWGN